MELLPREKDATNGETLFGYFAVIAAWAGEKDLALQQLNAAIPLPGATFITSYGILKLMPFWDRCGAIRALRKSFSRKRRNNRAKTFGQILYSKKRRRISNPACLVRNFQKATPGGVLTIS